MSALLHGVGVQAVAARGRGLVATSDIKSGETVLIDLPTFVVCNDVEHYCSNCLTDLSLPGQSPAYWNTMTGAWASSITKQVVQSRIELTQGLPRLHESGVL